MKKVWILLGICTLLATCCNAEQEVRIATYNIKWLSSETTNCGFIRVYDVRTQGQRLDRLRQVIRELDADIIGLQEIRDRTALDLVFSESDWTLVIDDDSRDCQNLALAVRHPFTVAGASNGRLNAETEHFIFADSEHDNAFPRNRDLLCVEVHLPNNAGSLYVMVHHAKSRYGGRHTTNPRRVAASQLIIRRLEQQFHEDRFVILGDFNDNPDDASLNILEIGDSNAITEMEDNIGTFLINLFEPLNADGHVSHGRRASDIINGQIDTIDSNSRRRNYEHRNDDAHTGDILFDQILVPHQVYQSYVLDSAVVFNRPIAVEGQSYRVASDHLPVYADFIFPTNGSDVAVRIISLLPNPKGKDAGNEIVILKNFGQSNVDLQGWKLRDKADNTYSLSGSIPPGQELEIRMLEFTMPLNNTGDRIELLSTDGNTPVPEVQYHKSDVVEGKFIKFEE